MQRIISRKLSQYLSNCKENILAQSPTTPVLKFRPSFQWLKDAFPYLIESGEGTVMQDGGQALDTIQEPISFNFEEYRQALKIFMPGRKLGTALWADQIVTILIVDYPLDISCITLTICLVKRNSIFNLRLHQVLPEYRESGHTGIVLQDSECSSGL